jgi:hypothetical protein
LLRDLKPRRRDVRTLELLCGLTFDFDLLQVLVKLFFGTSRLKLIQYLKTLKLWQNWIWTLPLFWHAADHFWIHWHVVVFVISARTFVHLRLNQNLGERVCRRGLYCFRRNNFVH